MIRLLVWCSVGADVENGLWSIYGARMGVHMTNLTDWDYINVRDFEYLNDIWNDKVASEFESYTSPYMCTTSGYCWDNDKLMESIYDIGREIRDHLKFEIAELDEAASKFFRKVFINPARVESKEAQ